MFSQLKHEDPSSILRAYVEEQMFVIQMVRGQKQTIPGLTGQPDELNWQVPDHVRDFVSKNKMDSILRNLTKLEVDQWPPHKYVQMLT